MFIIKKLANVHVGINFEYVENQNYIPYTKRIRGAHFCSTSYWLFIGTMYFLFLCNGNGLIYIPPSNKRIEHYKIYMLIV